MKPGWGNALLVGGLLVGGLLAALGVLEPGRETGRDPLPDGVVARVGPSVITVEAYEQALQAFAADRRADLTADDRDHVLQRLIDEELLVQYGLSLDLAARDPRTRTDLSAAVIAWVVGRAEEDAGEPAETALRSFFEANSGAFRTGPHLVVTHAFLRDLDDPGQPYAVRQALEAGEPVEGDPFPARVPEGRLTEQALAQYVGPTVAGAAVALPVGGVAGPLDAMGGFHFVRVVAREEAAVPAFDDVRDAVETAWRQRVGDQGLRAFLEAQREAAAIVVRGRND